MTKVQQQEADEVLLEQLCRAVGNPPGGEFVSELLRERREEAVRGEQAHE